MLLRVLFLLVGLLAIGAYPASAITLTFEDVSLKPGDNATDVGEPYESSFYSLTVLGSGIFFARNPWDTEGYYTGSTALYANQTNDVIQLTRTNGAPFSILAIDLAELGTFTTDAKVTFLGAKANGNSVSETFFFDQALYDLETFNFSDAFKSIVSLTWTQEGASHQFDNIVVRPPGVVPLPAGFLLLGTGIGAFGVVRRRYGLTSKMLGRTSLPEARK